MGGCQNYVPFLDPYYNTAPNIEGTQEGIIILTVTHMEPPKWPCKDQCPLELRLRWHLSPEAQLPVWAVPLL